MYTVAYLFLNFFRHFFLLLNSIFKQVVKSFPIFVSFPFLMSHIIFFLSSKCQSVIDPCCSVHLGEIQVVIFLMALEGPAGICDRAHFTLIVFWHKKTPKPPIVPWPPMAASTMRWNGLSCRKYAITGSGTRACCSCKKADLAYPSPPCCGSTRHDFGRTIPRTYPFPKQVNQA